MNIWDFLIIAVLAAAVVIALLSIRKNKKQGKPCSCGGDCSRCAGCKSKMSF